jgi:hypothetical protein
MLHQALGQVLHGQGGQGWQGLGLCWCLRLGARQKQGRGQHGRG